MKSISGNQYLDVYTCLILSVQSPPSPSKKKKEKGEEEEKKRNWSIKGLFYLISIRLLSAVLPILCDVYISVVKPFVYS